MGFLSEIALGYRIGNLEEKVNKLEKLIHQVEKENQSLHDKLLSEISDLIKKEHDGSFSEMEPISNHDYNAELQLI